MKSVERFKKVLAGMLAALMVITVLQGMSLKVAAAESDKTILDLSLGSLAFGNGTVTQGGDSLTYDEDGFIITGSGTTANTVTVTGGAQNLTVSNVNIDASAAGGCAFALASGSSVSLTLSGTNTLKSGGNNPGFGVPPGASLTIDGTNADTINITAGGGAGIGGGSGGSGGTVTINGGRITAAGGNGSAGIGGSSTIVTGTRSNSGSGGSVTINGGVVTATGGSTNRGGAGIGGASYGGAEDFCYGGSGGSVTINGGTVYANGVGCGAGIGGGGGGIFNDYAGNGGAVTITGGTVYASNDGNGSFNGAGIGGGGACFGGAAGTLIVSGGAVYVNVQAGTDYCGAGIGAGGTNHLGVNGGTVNISGGTVRVTSTQVIYDWPENKTVVSTGRIGGSYGWQNGFGSGGTVRITGGSVSAAIQSTPTSDETSPLYPTTLTLPSGQAVSSLIIEKNGTPVPYGILDMQADESGLLSLYLPASAEEDDVTAEVASGGTTYSGYHGTVLDSGTVAAPNVLKMDYSGFGFQSTGLQTFTYGDVISLDTAVTGVPDGVSVCYTYSGTDRLGNTYVSSSARPANASDDAYTVTAALAGSPSYYPAAVSKNFMIRPKNIGDGDVTLSAASATYAGTALSPDVAVAYGQISLNRGTDYMVYDESDTLNPTYIQAGEYSLRLSGSGNYTGSEVRTFSITQAPIALTLSTSKNAAKAGDSVILTAEVSGAADCPAGTVTFRCGGSILHANGSIAESGGKYLAQAAWSNVPAGEYDITAEYVPAAEDNYICSAQARINGYSITKQDQTGFSFADSTLSRTYGDCDFSVTASGGQGSGAVSYESSDESIATVTGEGVITIHGSGTVTITARKASDPVYNETACASILQIEKAVASILTPPAASSAVAYIGRLSTIAFTGGEAIVPGTFCWTDPDTLVSESGEYEATFMPLDAANYFSSTCLVAVNVTQVIANPVTGIQYDLSDAGLPEGVTSVSVQSSVLPPEGFESTHYALVDQLVDSGLSAMSSSVVSVYSLSLFDQSNQAVTGFTGKITVRILIPDGLSGDLRVYWYNDADGTVTDMNARQENGYLVFETGHFSYYAVAQISAVVPVETAGNPKTGNGSAPLAPAVLFGVSCLALVAWNRSGRFSRKK